MTETSADDWREHSEYLAQVAALTGVTVSELVQPQEVQLVVGGQRLHCLDWHGPSRRSVVFLHGGGLNAHTWDLICLALRPRFRCLALDLRGHGDSEWSPNLQYGIDAHVADVKGMVSLLGLSNFIVVGGSLGGLVALAYAADCSSLIELAVVLDVTPRGHGAGVARIGEFLRRDVEYERVEDFVTLALQVNPRRDPQLLAHSVRLNLHQLPNGKWRWKHDPRYRQRPDLRAFDVGRQRLWGRLHEVRCRTLVIRGSRSDVCSDESAAELADALPLADCMTVSDAGHNIHGDNPRGLLEVLEPFLIPLTCGVSHGGG
jgi:esterase